MVSDDKDDYRVWFSLCVKKTNPFDKSVVRVVKFVLGLAYFLFYMNKLVLFCYVGD